MIDGSLFTAVLQDECTESISSYSSDMCSRPKIIKLEEDLDDDDGSLLNSGKHLDDETSTLEGLPFEDTCTDDCKTSDQILADGNN